MDVGYVGTGFSCQQTRNSRAHVAELVTPVGLEDDTDRMVMDREDSYIPTRTMRLNLRHCEQIREVVLDNDLG